MAELSCVFSMNFNIVLKLYEVTGHVTCENLVGPGCVDVLTSCLVRRMELLSCTLAGHLRAVLSLKSRRATLERLIHELQPPVWHTFLLLHALFAFVCSVRVKQELVGDTN